MNHHIHPLADAVSGERRLLSSCRSKSKPNTCKGGFPLESHITEKPLLVCPCVAAVRDLCMTGPRSLVGTILPTRNSAWLNAGPSAWLVFSGDNGDIKFPHRMPIIPETHEEALKPACCNRSSSLQMTYDMQAGQAVTAGYFGGYSSKMQDVGRKELNRMEKSLLRKVASKIGHCPAKRFP